MSSITTSRVILKETKGRVQSYSVSDIEVVSPEDTFKIQETSGTRITLITCYPFDYIGPAPKRYVVRGISEEDI